MQPTSPYSPSSTPGPQGLGSGLRPVERGGKKKADSQGGPSIGRDEMRHSLGFEWKRAQRMAAIETAEAGHRVAEVLPRQRSHQPAHRPSTCMQITSAGPYGH